MDNRYCATPKNQGTMTMEALWLSAGRHGGSVVGGMMAQIGRHGGSVMRGMVAQNWEAWWPVVARLAVVLHSRVRIWRLPRPQLTANLLVGCHLGWHLAVG